MLENTVFLDLGFLLITRQFIEFNLFKKPIQIKWYGICYLIGFLLVRERCIKILYKKFEQNKINFDENLDLKLENLSQITLLFGIIGGRLWHLVNRYLHFGIPMYVEAIHIWRGGMAFQGGLICGATAGIFYLLLAGYKKQLPLICDVIFSQLPLAIMIGRFGNFANQEFIQPINAGELLSDFSPEKIADILYEIEIPLCLFSSATEGFMLFLLTNYWINRKMYVPYQTTLVFLLGYSVMRLINDRFRDELSIGTLKISEYICIGLMIISISALLINYMKGSNKSMNDPDQS